MDANQIQAFLSKGTLDTYKGPDWEGKTRTAANIIWRAAQSHRINPQFLLVLLQKEQSLVESSAPSQKQLDWATGYGVCDDCSLSDTGLARWKGFGKQVNSAALQFSEGYMADINSYGMTVGKYGPGITVSIDNTLVTPVNAATAAMYAYTPHLHGNFNFTAIWNRWFGKDYPNGTLLQVAGTDGVHRIENGYRRPITSRSALISRYNSNLIITVSQTVLDQYPIGIAISLPNYSLVKDEKGNIYLLVDDKLRHITSMEAFRMIGFSEDELVDITSTEVGTYQRGTPLTTASADPNIRIVKIKTNGSLFAIKDGERRAILDPAILKANYPNIAIELVGSSVVEQYKEGKFLTLPDGTLVRGVNDPAVFVVADGEKRAILSAQDFTDYGYSWSNVTMVNDDVLALHKTGNHLGATTDDQNSSN